MFEKCRRVILRFKTPPSILIARRRSAHRCTPCQRVVVPIHFRISHFYLYSGNHCRKVGFQCRHSQIVRRAEIRLGDKPATDPSSQQPSLAASLSNFISLLQENSPILRLPGFRQLPENIQVYFPLCSIQPKPVS